MLLLKRYNLTATFIPPENPVSNASANYTRATDGASSVQVRVGRIDFSVPDGEGDVPGRIFVECLH